MCVTLIRMNVALNFVGRTADPQRSRSYMIFACRNRPAGDWVVSYCQHCFFAPTPCLDELVDGRATCALAEQRRTARRQIPHHLKIGQNARQIAYLLTGMTPSHAWVTTARFVLVDEAESYSLLAAHQRPKASFPGGDLCRLRDQQTILTADQFPQHRYRQYPIALRPGQSLFFSSPLPAAITACLCTIG